MSSPLSSNRSPDRIADTLAVATLSVIAVIALLTFRDYGLGWDDYTHAQYGDLLLALYGSGFHDQRAFSFVNLYMYGGGFDMVAALAAKILPFDLFETRRLVGAVVGLIGLAITWRIGRRVGGPVAGIVALLLLATCPLYYGHMFMNAKDAPFAVAMALLMLGLVRAFQDYPRPTAPTVAIAGLGLGLAVGTRVIGGIAAFYALPAIALLLAIEARGVGLRHAGARLGRFALVMLPGLALAYLVMGLVWPWSVIAPLNPLRAAEYFSTFFEKPWKEMFDGAAVLVPDMPRSYVPTWFALTMPEVFLALGIGGTAGAFVAAARGDVEPRRRALLLMLAIAAILPIAVTVVTRPAMYNGIRHFVFVTPPLAVLGGVAAAWLGQWIGRFGRRAVAAGVVALVAALALPAIEMVRLHPYQYTHFNRVSGGIRMAEDRFMIDYWGLALKQAGEELRGALVERLETPAHGRRWKVAVCGPTLAAAAELGPEFDVTWDSRGADFALMMGEKFFCKELNAPVLGEVEREGVVYARVYDIRSRAVSSLFVILPVQ